MIPFRKKTPLSESKWMGGANMPLGITACYLACGLVYYLLDRLFIHHESGGMTALLADLTYIVITAAIVYFLLLSNARQSFQIHETALRESEDRLARILETNASGIVVFERRTSTG